MTGPVEVPAGPLPLRPWRPGDAPAALAGLTDPVTDVFGNPGRIRTPADADEWVARRARWTDDRVAWAVADADHGGVLGSLSLHAIDPVQGNAVMGYRTAPAARGRGVTARAVDAGCRWAFRYADGVKRDELLWARLSDDDVPELSTRS